MSKLRLPGMASGMDINQMVKDLMKAESAKVNKLRQNKELIEWKQARYSELTKSYANFVLDVRKDFGFTNVNTVGQVNGSSLTELSWAKSATNASTAFTVTPTAEAANTSYTLKVNALATGVTSSSSAAISVDKTATNIKDQFNLASNVVLNFKIETQAGSKDFSFTDIANTSIDDIVKQINDSGIGVQAIYDKTTDRFFLQGKDTGAASYIKITETPLSDGSGGFFPHKRMFTGTSLTKTGFTDGVAKYGTDASINFNGSSNILMPSNEFTMAGLNIKLNAKVTTAQTITVSTNTDKVFEKVKGFVDKFNSMVKTINTAMTEKRNQKMNPLTKDEKADLTEDEIKDYIEGAKKGIIANDNVVNSITNKLREGLLQEVKNSLGPIGRLGDLGISFASLSNGGKEGLLQLDESKLRNAISTDVDKVMDVLFKQPDDPKFKTTFEKNLTSAEIATKREQSGIFNRMTDIISEGMVDLIGRGGANGNESLLGQVNGTINLTFISKYKGVSNLDNQKITLNNNISDWEDRLTKVENKYFEMFARMESALSKMNSQSSWLGSTFS